MTTGNEMSRAHIPRALPAARGKIKNAEYSRRGFVIEFVDVLSWKSLRRRVQASLFLDSSSRIVKSWYMNHGGDLGLATLLTK